MRLSSSNVLTKVGQLGRGVLIAGMLLAAAAPAIAWAAPTDEDPAPAAETAKQPWAPALERLFQRDQRVLLRAEKMLEKATTVQDKLQKRMDELKARGKDTADLDQALAEFKAAVAQARTYYDTVESALEVHAGFSDEGKVSDREQARDTVKTAGAAERQFVRAMYKAGRDLRKDIKAYRQDYKSSGQVTPARPAATSPAR